MSNKRAMEEAIQVYLKGRAVMYRLRGTEHENTPELNRMRCPLCMVELKHQTGFLRKTGMCPEHGWWELRFASNSLSSIDWGNLEQMRWLGEVDDDDLVG